MSILMPREKSPNIVWVGDSTVWGSQTASPGGATSPPYFLAGLLGLTYETHVFNHGVPGLGSTDLEDVDQLLSNRRPNILILQVAVNDIYAGVPATHRPAADIYANIVAWCIKRRKSGRWSKIYVTTPTGNGLHDTTGEAIHAALATLLRNDTEHFDGIIDNSADAVIGLGGTGADLSIDSVHLNATGNARVAANAYAVIDYDGMQVGRWQSQFGMERDASLTGNFRDWVTIATNNPEIFDWFNNKENRILRNYFVLADQASPNRVNRIPNALAENPVLDFTGDDTCYFSSATHVDHFFKNDELVIHVLLSAAATSVNEATAYSNPGIVNDGASMVGMFRKDGKIIAYANDDGSYTTQVETDIDDDVWSLATMRIKEGTIGVRVIPLTDLASGSSGTWEEDDCDPVVDLTAGTLIGKSTGLLHCFEGQIAEVGLRGAGGNAKDASDLRYFRSRYALGL